MVEGGGDAETHGHLDVFLCSVSVVIIIAVHTV